MKKIILTLVAVLSFGSVFASNDASNSNEATSVVIDKSKSYDMSVNYNRLGQALGLSRDQMVAVEEVHNQFTIEMDKASTLSGAEREALIDKALNRELKNMNYILDYDQYRKFLMILNVTFSNRDLN